MDNFDISPAQFLNGLEINKLIYCKELTDLNADHKPGDNVTGQFKIGDSFSRPPQLILHNMYINRFRMMR